MKLFKRVIYKNTVSNLIFISFLFAVLTWISNKLFDKNWEYKCMSPLINMDDVYSIPKEYDYFPKVNLKLLDSASLCIEGNRRFKTLGSFKDYAYYDTIKINKPDSLSQMNNKIFFDFQNSDKPDSMYLVISHTTDDGIYWNQIYYSSIKIKLLNQLSPDPKTFRLNTAALVSQNLLKNNDILINQVINYFNLNEKSLGLAECGTDSRILKSICDKFKLPCRIIFLQGGDSFETGYNDMVGYPTHVICEIYSSRYRKWYVIDPLYGSIFRKDQVPLNAAEISNIVFSGRDSHIVQDSVLTTRNTILNKDYFNYYRNIFYDSKKVPTGFTQLILKHFYKLYNYKSLHYSHKTNENMNGNVYNILKSLMYLMITAVYGFTISAVLRKRLYKENNKTHSPIQ